MAAYTGIRSDWYSLLPYLSSTHVNTNTLIRSLSPACHNYITHTLSLLPPSRQIHLVALALSYQRAILQTLKARIRMYKTPTDLYDVWAAKASLDEVQRNFDFRYRSDEYVSEEAVRCLQREEGDRRAGALGSRLLDLLGQTEVLRGGGWGVEGGVGEVGEEGWKQDGLLRECFSVSLLRDEERMLMMW